MQRHGNTLEEVLALDPDVEAYTLSVQRSADNLKEVGPAADRYIARRMRLQPQHAKRAATGRKAVER